MSDETENLTEAEIALANAKAKTEEATEDQYIAQKKLNEAIAKGTVDLKEFRDNIIEAKKETKKLAKEQEDLADALGLARDQGDTMASSLLRATGMSQDFERSVMGSALALSNNEDAMKSFTEKLEKNMTMQNASIMIIQKFAEATIALSLSTDTALASFNKQTGATRLYGAEIKALEQDMFHHGVGIDAATEGYGSLVSNVTDLRLMSSGARKELVTTTGLLSHLGVSADTTGANVQFMTKSLGVGVGEASKYQRELFTLAQEIGMPPEEMAAGFKAAAPKLAAFGKQAGKVFTKLAKNARSAGLEVQQMLSIVEQFDTFEGAAESVGKLNALLGGPFLNSMEMVMTTDPTERMKLLSGALNDAGKSFDQMTYYEKKSIAAAAGLSDVNELALVMAGSFDESAGGAHKSQAEIEKLAEQSKEFNDLAAEMTQTMRLFAMQLEPVVYFLKWVLQGIQNISQATGGKFIPIVLGAIVAIKAITTATKIWGTVSSWVAGKNALVTSSTITKTAAEGASIPVTVALGTTAGAAATPMLYFAVAALAVGAAFFLVGAGVGLAAQGMSLFMLSLALIPPADLAKYGLALWSISSGIGALALAMIIGGSSLAGLSLNLLFLGWALSKLDFDKLQAVEGLFSSMAEAMNAPIENLATMTAAIKGITDAIKSVDDINAVVAVSSLIGTTSKSSQSHKGGSSPPPKTPVQDHKITLHWDPRSSTFEDYVIEIVDGQLNPNKFGYSTP